MKKLFSSVLMILCFLCSQVFAAGNIIDRGATSAETTAKTRDDVWLSPKVIPDITKYAHISDYDADFDEAIADINATETTLVVDEACTMSDNITVPSTLSLRVLKGCPIDTGGYKLTINGPFEVGLYQAFDGNGDVVFGVAAVEAVRPEWFGAVADGITDCAAALNACINSMTISTAVHNAWNWKYRPTVKFGGGTYYLASGVTFSHKNFMTFKGEPGCTWIKIAAGVTGFTTSDGTDDCWFLTFEDINFTGPAIHTMGTPVTAGTRALWIRGARDVKIRNCRFFELAEAIRYTNSSQALIDKCRFQRSNWHIVSDIAEAGLDGAGPDTLRIRNCEFSGSEYEAIKMVSIVLDFSLKDCYLGSYGYSDNDTAAVLLATRATKGNGANVTACGIELKNLRFENPQGTNAYAIKIDDYNNLDTEDTWFKQAYRIVIENVRELSGIGSSANGLYLDHCIGVKVKQFTTVSDPASHNNIYIGQYCRAADIEMIYSDTDNPDVTAIVNDNAIDKTNNYRIIDRQTGEIFVSEGSYNDAPGLIRSCTGEYNFSINGGSTGNHILGYIPNNAIIIQAWYEVLTQPTSDGNATISFGIPGDDAVGILAPMAYADAAFNVGLHDAIPDGTAAHMTNKSTTIRSVVMSISTAALTGGKIRLFWKYIVSD